MTDLVDEAAAVCEDRASISWLDEPNPSLKNETPRDRAARPGGAEDVRAILLAIPLAIVFAPALVEPYFRLASGGDPGETEMSATNHLLHNLLSTEPPTPRCKPADRRPGWLRKRLGKRLGRMP